MNVPGTTPKLACGDIRTKYCAILATRDSFYFSTEAEMFNLSHNAGIAIKGNVEYPSSG